MKDDMPQVNPKVAVIGTGIIGIASAYFLARNHGVSDIVLIDQGQPMAFTSAQSGENYRNWWPHPLMVDFTDRSIDLMEEIARESGNRIAMTRRGYILASREDEIQPMLDRLDFSLGRTAGDLIRIHGKEASSYMPPVDADWQSAPSGFDILRDQQLIRSTFPSLDPEVRSILHIRRGGDISGQQLGQHMLDWLRENGARRVNGTVTGIDLEDGFHLSVSCTDGEARLHVDRIVNAAGPFAGQIAAMVGVDLPLYNVMQQKIAFPDVIGAIPRNLPFAIDLDPQMIDWEEEDRKVLEQDPTTARLAAMMPGAIHCRPDGGDGGTWVKLGWAYNEAPALVSREIPIDPQFPEIVLRGAARLNPALKSYYGQLPRQMHHYGGWYTRTSDNWPLIGPMGSEGAFMACALSGHGTMAACATGELLAKWMVGEKLPDYGTAFSLARYTDVTNPALEIAEDGLL